MSQAGKPSPKHGAGNTIGTYQDSTRPDYDEDATPKTGAARKSGPVGPGAIPAGEQGEKPKGR